MVMKMNETRNTTFTLEVKDKDGFFVGFFRGYQEAAIILGIDEKTVRNITSGKFKTNRKGYTITAIAKGGVAL